jgi:ribonuclease P protein component
MPKTLSIKENRLFRAAYARGRSAARKTMAVYVLKDRCKTVNRLGITVSVKLGGAVQRNRIRRRLKETYRLCETRLSGGHDIVIVGRHAALTAPFETLQADFASIARELRLEEQA